MNQQGVLHNLARVFPQGSNVFAYSLNPKAMRLLSTAMLTALSEAIEGEIVSERYLPSEHMVELRLTRLGKRSLASYRRYRERMIGENAV